MFVSYRKMFGKIKCFSYMSYLPTSSQNCQVIGNTYIFYFGLGRKGPMAKIVTFFIVSKKVTVSSKYAVVISCCTRCSPLLLCRLHFAEAMYWDQYPLSCIVGVTKISVTLFSGIMKASFLIFGTEHYFSMDNCICACKTVSHLPHVHFLFA